MASSRSRALAVRGLSMAMDLRMDSSSDSRSMEGNICSMRVKRKKSRRRRSETLRAPSHPWRSQWVDRPMPCREMVEASVAVGVASGDRRDHAT